MELVLKKVLYAMISFFPFILDLSIKARKTMWGKKCYMSIVALDHKWENPHCLQQKRPREQTYNYN